MLIPQVSGSGILNSAINSLPFELHLPGYQFCGPGTKLKERLSKGQKGINGTDAACRVHDIAYSKHKSLEERHKADYDLENRAWERFKSNDASAGERAAAWAITTGMKAKRKLGMGMKKGGKLSFRQHILLPILKTLTQSIEGAGLKLTKKSLLKPSLIALRAAKKQIKKLGGKRKIRVPRIIPFESKTGGFLPLIPLFGALSALGALSGGASAIAKTVIDAKNAKQKLAEDQRHNQVMEEIGRKGSGLYLKKSKKGGYGLYLKKQSKNFH